MDKAHPVALLTAYGKEEKQIIPGVPEMCENSWKVKRFIYRLHRDKLMQRNNRVLNSDIHLAVNYWNIKLFCFTITDIVFYLILERC